MFNLKKFFTLGFVSILLIQSIIATNNFQGNPIEVAIRRSKINLLQEALKKNGSDLQDKNNLQELAQDMVKYRREKSLRDKIGFNKKNQLEAVKGLGLIYLGIIGASASTIALTGDPSSTNELLGVLGSIASVGAIFKGFQILSSIPSPFQVLRDKYNESLKVKALVNLQINKI